MPPEASPGNTLDHVPRGDGGKWQPGQSGNPSGRPPRMRACREAVDGARDPEKVTAMLRAFYERGIAGDTVAGKIWLDRVLGPAQNYRIDLSGAPDDVLEWLGENL